MTERRRFNNSERIALYLAAAGKCEKCGIDLEAGWHSDHVHPYSRGGKTNLANGQAYCPTCNAEKGSSVGDLWQWQREALDKFMRTDSVDFVAAACPGAGKTTWALTVARKLMDRGEIDRVVVVTPSDSLRTQWSNHTSAGIALRPYTLREPMVDKHGYDGVVTSYQALMFMAASVIEGSIDRRTLVILDEIHHAADNSEWGTRLRLTFANAGKRLMLTGTPWRTNPRESMAFAEFDKFSGELHVDYRYDYGRAVLDKVCRPIQFPAVNGSAKFRRKDVVSTVDMSVDEGARREDRSAATATLLDAGGEWMADIISRAHEDLMSMRQEIPDAGGLIVAYSKEHGEQLKALLRRITGVQGPLVVSGEDNGDSDSARKAIEDFRDGTAPWIIAVKMIAEGVDIPRLMVGVYATRTNTAMFFNQVVGRFVRTRKKEKAVARLYVPPTPELWAHVRRIEKLVPQKLIDELCAPGGPGGGGGGGGEGNWVSLSSESRGLDRVWTRDGELAGDAVTAAQLALSATSVPAHYATDLVGAGWSPPGVRLKEPEERPRHVLEKSLRSEVFGRSPGLVNRVAKHCYGDHRVANEVANDLYKRMGLYLKYEGRPKNQAISACMSLTELAQAKEILSSALENGSRI